MRRRMRMRRAPRRKTQWYAGAQSLCGQRLTVIACDFEGYNGEAELFSLLENPADAVDGQVGSGGDDVTILRVVGSLWLYSSISAADATEPQFQTVSFHMGMYVGDDTAVDGIVMNSPVLSADASSKDWLWRDLVVHAYHAGLGQTNQNQVSPASSPLTYPHVDVKVKRKLRKEEDLIFAIQATTDNPFPAGTNRLETTAFLYADLRVLAAMS